MWEMTTGLALPPRLDMVGQGRSLRFSKCKYLRVSSLITKTIDGNISRFWYLWQVGEIGSWNLIYLIVFSPCGNHAGLACPLVCNGTVQKQVCLCSCHWQWPLRASLPGGVLPPPTFSCQKTFGRLAICLSCANVQKELGAKLFTW